MPTIVETPISQDVTYYIAVDSDTPTTFSISLADNSVGEGALPPGALGMLDFKNGVYKWGSTTYAPSDLIDHPEFVLTGIGLYIDAYYSAGDAVRLFDDTPFYDHLQGNEFAVTFEVSASFYAGFLWATKNAPNPPFGVLDFESEPSLPSGGFPFIYWEIMGGQGGSTQFFDDPAYNAVPDRAMFACSGSLSDNSVHMCWDTGPNAGTVYSDTGNPQAMATITAGIWIGGSESGAYDNMLISRIVFYPYANAATLPTYLQEPVMEFPDNDLIIDAQTIALDEVVTAHNYTASAEEGEPSHGRASRAITSLWYKFTAPSTANYKVLMTDWAEVSDLAIGIYTAGSPISVTTLTEIDGNYNPGPYDEVTWAATSGVTYYIAIDDRSGVRHSFEFHVEAA